MKQYEGKDVESILASIAEQENIDIADINYRVVNEHKGFLGIGNKITIEVIDYSDIKDFIFEYLNNYFTSANLIVNIEFVQDEHTIITKLDCDNNARLIGKNGYTLQTITYLLKTAVKSKFNRYYSIVVDAGNYKKKRYEKLCSHALRVAKEVSKTKITAKLDAMPSDERKEIHKYLINMPHIRTVSEGKGLQRKITIIYDSEKM